ncbi:MAG TPA: glycosyltransferase family 4 protein [Terriglobales bacterium]|nr:glycosyltransferase family 4 protein [Terriglobales bacterium]
MNDTSSHYLRGTVTWSRPLALPPVMPERSNNPRVAYIMNVFPNLTETFVYRELATVRGQGVDVIPFAIRRPKESDVSRDAQHYFAETVYILPLSIPGTLREHLRALAARPLRYLRLLWQTGRGQHQSWRDRGRSLAHFIEAIALIPAIRASGVEHLHAHFAVGSATCAWILGSYLDLPFSFTAHAYDIYLDRLLLPEKLRDAGFVVTCTEENRRHLLATYRAQPQAIRVVHHGVDIDRFVPSPRSSRETPRILSVGRLCEQKGFDVLLRACALLAREGVAFRCDIVGDGPLREPLEALVAELELGERVRFVGRAFQEELPGHYAAADIFALACKRASDNDRDGIPNTLMEAMASGLPVVSTRFSGVPELVLDGTTGLLAPPEDPAAFADGLRRLLADAELRWQLGNAGRMRVTREFSLERAAAELIGFFRASINDHRSRSIGSHARGTQREPIHSLG